MTRCRVLSLSASVAILLAFAGGAARGDTTKAQCIDANTKGQDLRRAGKLTAARNEFRLCASPDCPAMLRGDCTKRLDDLEVAQPTIVFDPKDGSGRDLSAVTATIDGHPFSDRLDGTAQQADPGEHVFVFTMPGQAPVTRTFVLKEGEKARREPVVIGPAVTDSSAQPTEHVGKLPSYPSASESGGGLGTQRILGLVLSGVGVAGIAVGTVFGLMVLSNTSQQKADCASTEGCTNRSGAVTDHSNAETDRTISTTGFIAGGALLVVGAVVFFAGGQSSEAQAPSGLLVLPTLGPGGGGMSLKGEF